jgi:hypothetical protein
MQQSNSLGNVMNIEANAQTAYDNLKWGIHAKTDNGTVRNKTSICIETTYLVSKVKYTYRRVPYTALSGPGFIKLHDGDEIVFGDGPEGARLGLGPNPLLCNLQLSVARVLRMSGAAEVISQMMDDGDDSDFPHVYVASQAFCNILTAKLLVSGRVVGVV